MTDHLTNAQLAEWLILIADISDRSGGNPHLNEDDRNNLRLAAQRLEAMDELMNFAEAALKHIDNPLIAMHLSAVIQAASKA